MFCIPKVRNSVYSHLFPYNKQISPGSLLPSFRLFVPLTRTLCSFYFRFNAIESERISFTRENDIYNKSIFSSGLFTASRPRNVCLCSFSTRSLNIHWFDFACSKLNKVQPKRARLSWYFDPEETDSHNKFVSELYPHVRKVHVHSSVSSFVRLFV